MDSTHTSNSRGVAKRLLAENLALVAGVALPLVLMALFFIAGRAAVVTTAPPGYDALLAVNYDESWPNQPWRIQLENGRVVLRFDADASPGVRGVPRPEIHVLDHETLQTSRLDIDFASTVDGVVEDPELDALNRRRLLAGPESPDGYRVERRSSRRSGGPVGEILGFGGARSPYVLRHEGRTIPIRGAEPIYQVHLIAWIAE